jgi:hypothetical protein
MHSTAKAWGNQRRMRARSIRGTPMAGLVPSHHAGAAGPCRARLPAGARQKKHLKVRCRSVCRRFADCYAVSYGAALTLSSTCCPGRHGVAGTNTAHSSATTGDAAAYRQFPYIYGCRVCHEHGRKPVMLYQRWEQASRSRPAGAGFKPPGAAAFKRRGGVVP